MYYREIQPPSHLADLIRYYWILEDRPDDSSQAINFRVLADGYPGFIFTYGNNSDWKFMQPSNPVPIPQCSFFGVLQHFRDLYVHGSYGILGISFFSHSFHTLLDIPANEIANQSIGIEDLYGYKGKHLREKLQNATDNTERIAFINDFLTCIQQDTLAKNTVVRQGVLQILSQKGTTSISSLTQHLGISRRHFERRFKALVGISPKQYSRIIRFQQVLRYPFEPREMSLANLAFICGYSDQPHFIREFKTFAGFTPRCFFSETDEVVENFVHFSE